MIIPLDWEGATRANFLKVGECFCGVMRARGDSFRRSV